jgi:sigma-B regulation protein RsbU (phosphoserine phosphatase)
MSPANGEAVDGFIEALLDDDAGQLYDRAPCGYLSTTPDGTIVKVNQTLLTLTGYERTDLVGERRFADLLTGGGRIYHETHYAPMLRMQGSARELALDLVCKDGSRLPALVNAVLERDEHGSPTVIRVAVFDATQRRHYERELVGAKERAEVSEARATALARTLQQTLIPLTPPRIPDLDVGARYRPAGAGDEVGGDFYDVFQVSDGWAVTIGDVCGKGAEAAVVTALVRHSLRAAAMQSDLPSAALLMMDEVLQQYDTDRFCTALMVRLRPSSSGWTAVVSSGGHPLPVLRRGDGTIELVGEPGSLMGVLPDPQLHDTEVELRPGDSLVAYTDGVPEGRDTTGAMYGEGRLVQVLERVPVQGDELAEALLHDLMLFQQDEARDDIAVVVISVPHSDLGGVAQGAP